METKIALRYKGPAVDDGTMDVYEAAANMIAFSEFVVLAAKGAYGGDVDAKAQVSGFGRGSFETDLVFKLTGLAANIFTVTTTDDLLRVVKESVQLWKHLRGEPAAKVERTGNTATVTNNNGQITQVTIGALSVVLSEKGSDAVGQFVRKALERPGMDAVEIKDQAGGQLESISQNEARFFVPVAPSESVTDTVVRMALVIEAPVFKDDLKWRFSDGQSSFHAEIRDQDFLDRVNAGERFGKGDVLHADVRIEQQQSGARLTTERSITKVHQHREAAQQLKLT